MPSKDSHLRKSIRILQLMVDKPINDWSLREIGNELGLPTSTTFRQLRTMINEGLVRYQDNRYSLGLEFYRLAFRAQVHFPISEIAIPFMSRLNQQSGETILLGIYDPVEKNYFFTSQIITKHAIRHEITLQERFPLYAGAGGLAIMAFLSPDDRQEIINRTNLQPLTEQTITIPIILENELKKIRDCGYALTHGQRIPGAVAFGVPIFTPKDKVIGCMVITMPEQRYDRIIEPELSNLLIYYAHCVYKELWDSPLNAN